MHQLGDMPSPVVVGAMFDITLSKPPHPCAGEELYVRLPSGPNLRLSPTSPGSTWQEAPPVAGDGGHP